MEQSTEGFPQLLRRLSGSVQAFSTVVAAAELGMLQALTRPLTVEEVAKETDLDPNLARALLDVLAGLNLVQQEGDSYGPTPHFRSFAQAADWESLMPTLRSTHFQSRHLADAARHRQLHPGWNFTDPEILQAQGRTAKVAFRFWADELFPSLPGLEDRLRAPGGAFLDVGSGVGIISIEMCRAYPLLKAVGLEPAPAPIAEARRNIAEAGLEDRIEIRSEVVENFVAQDSFDLAWFPQVFMPVDVAEKGFHRIGRALRPGGWVLALVISSPGESLAAALSRLQNVLWGGSPLSPEEVAAMARSDGYESVRIVTAPGTPYSFIVAQRPY